MSDLLREFVKCEGCGEVFDTRSVDACPQCGADPPDPDSDFDPDPDLDDAIDDGFGDGRPFAGDVYADYRSVSYSIVESEKWTRWRRFVESELNKSRLQLEMKHACMKLRGEKHLSDALDAWERATKAWDDLDDEGMRRELQPWIDLANEPATEPPPSSLLFERCKRFLLGVWRA